MAVRSALFDVKAAIEESKWTAIGALFAFLGSPQASTQTPESNAGMQSITGSIAKIFGNFSSKIDATILLIDTTRPEDDTAVRQAVTNICWPVVSFGAMYGKVASVVGLDPVGGLEWIPRLLELKELGLDERWAAATCYLAGMEIAINKALDGMNLTGEQNEDFTKKFGRLTVALKDKGKPLTGLSKQFPQAFWRLRNDIIHAGYCPASDELELIIKWVREMMKSLGALSGG